MWIRYALRQNWNSSSLGLSSMVILDFFLDDDDVDPIRIETELELIQLGPDINGIFRHVRDGDDVDPIRIETELELIQLGPVINGIIRLIFDCDVELAFIIWSLNPT